jgi:hypothetical protein
MIKIEHIEIWGFAHAIRGMRNPMNSWEKSDTIYGEYHGKDENGNDIVVKYDAPQIGTNDADLMHRLFKAGTEHRKFMRQIFVSMDIIAPLYWWKEFDTYKVGTTANSCSTMHKLMSKPFELEDFSTDQMNTDAQGVLCGVIRFLNMQRDMYLNGVNCQMKGSQEFWWNVVQLLPTSYNQRRTVTISYENAAAMIRQRTGHKLEEWRVFVEHLQELPHMDTIVLGNWEKEGEEV